MTIESTGEQPGDADKVADPDATEHELDTIRAMFDALRACWVPPPQDEARPGMQMSVRFAFKRSGNIIATPRVTYVSPGAPPEAREVYLHAITANLISAGLRLIPLGQTDGQRVLAALEPVVAATALRALATPIDDIGSAALRADLASMLHETQYTRLFRS